MSFYDILLAKKLSGGGGGSSVTVEALSVTSNGTYSETGKAYSPVSVNVPQPSGSTSISENGTYDVTAFAEAVVNVSGGGGFTLLYSGEVEASTTSTSVSTIETLENISGIWDIDVIIYVKIRDKAGPRANYFYGTDSFILRDTTASPNSDSLKFVRFMTSSAMSYTTVSGTSGFGVYPRTIYADNKIDIAARYNQTSSKTIDGTYTIEIYKIAYPS